ncbi:hypothetical protein SCHPADRAFT_941159 [Schizopora paradoxa]|uniref:Uncharacterized protein n=1 Tax=Schizopora paradoxa TaxID=27342 RepID=A0A0H2RLQ7_9AGAM|nr:hypothetical protein SCHPADRAFT_941159 [Schizopora paradoxa]
MNTSLTTSTATAMTASSAARSPFFHARLQQGQRFNEFGQLQSSPTRLPEDLDVSSEASHCDPRGVTTTSGSAIKTAHSLPSNARAGSSKLPAHHTISGGKSSLNSSTILLPLSLSKRMPGDTAMSDSTQDLFASIAAEVSTPSPEGRQYHYITRSQSTGGGYSPEPTKEKHSSKSTKSSPSSTLISSDSREPQIPNPGNTYIIPPIQRNLSPIDEGSPRDSPLVHIGPQSDTVSVHSTTSNQSNLFINRPVRRTASTSSFNSVNSIPPRSAAATSEREESQKIPHTFTQTNPSRSAYPRTFPALPVIPASPRESQNVPHDETDSTGLKFPQPAAFLSRRQDYNGFIAPGGIEGEHAEGDEYGTGSNAIGLAIGTPSRRISVADSVRTADTQYTYLTAESPAQSRRGTMADGSGVSMPRHQRSKENAKSSSKLRDLESGLATEDAPLGDGSSRRLQRAKLLLVALKRRMQVRRSGAQVPDAEGNDARAEALGTLSGEKKSGAQKARMGPISLVAHIAFSGMTKRKPSELLFWAGFVAPWCWLIGGWMLRKDGYAVDGGYDENRNVRPTEALYEREGEKGVGVDPKANARRSRNADLNEVDEQNRFTTATNFAVVPSTRTSISDDRPDSAGAKGDTGTAEPRTPATADERKRGLSAAWESARNSSAEIFDAIRGPRPGDSEDTEATLRPGLKQESRVSVVMATRVDRWVARCRVAAGLSGLVLLALCIAAIVELVRSL